MEPILPDRPSLRDLAHELGVSHTTVADALKDRAKVSKSTREKIQKYAKERGYYRNPVLSALGTKRFHASALHDHTRTPLFFEYMEKSLTEAYSKAAKELGYHIDLIQVQNEKELTQALRRAYHQGVQGILIANIASWEVVCSPLFNHFSVLAIGPLRMGNPFTMIWENHIEETKTVFRELRKRGFKRIGAIRFKHALKVPGDELRKAGFYLANQNKGPDETLIPAFYYHENSPVPFHEKETMAELKHWMDHYQPDAFVFFNYGLYEALPEKHPIRNLPAASLRTLPGHEVSGISIPADQISETAIRILDSFIRHNVKGAPKQREEITVRGQWNSGLTIDR